MSYFERIALQDSNGNAIGSGLVPGTVSLPSRGLEVITSIGDNASSDSFGRLRVSFPAFVLDSQQQYDQDPLEIESGATGTGVSPSYSTTTRCSTLSCTAGSGTSYQQTYQYNPYRPGRSQLVWCTFVMGPGVANVTKDVGLFDANNGVFLRQNGTSGMEVHLRSSTSGSVADTTVAQSSWNVDTLNGSGPSGKTLDFTKDTILVIDFQFLSMGRVRVGFCINGLVFFVQTFVGVNNLSLPYAQQMTLPFQALVTAASSSNTGSLVFKCFSVLAEDGASEEVGFQFSSAMANASTSDGSRTHLLSIQPKTTFNGITNRTKVNLKAINITSNGTYPAYWELCAGVIFGDVPSWSDVNSTYSAVSQGTGGTYSSAALVISSGFTASGSFNTIVVSPPYSRIPIALNRAGAATAQGTLSLLATGVGGAPAVYASMVWEEVR